MRIFGILFLLLAIPFQAWGILPLQSFQDLAAGNTIPGYRDGPFYSALFHSPKGLAFNPEGTLLYIADSDNHCIRVVDREHGNQVSTLTGKGKPGYADGSFSDALFNEPSLLSFLPNQQILVYDEGNVRFRLIDLAKKTVTTLAGNGKKGMADGPALQASVDGVWSMAYLPARNGIYFTGNGALRKLDLKTGQVMTVFQSKPELPQPGALAVKDGRLDVADAGIGGQVYQLTPKDKFTEEKADSFDWFLLSKGQSIGQMTWSGNVLYALQQYGAPLLVRLTPQYQPVTFTTIWGDTPAQNWAFCSIMAGADGGYPRFLAPDPVSERKLYFTHSGANIVTSYRDLFLRELKDAESINPDGLTDFLYPTTKPPDTFRILVIGDSHTFHQYDEDIKKRDWDSFNRFATVSKRAEETLNTLAALEDIPWHFEVLHYGEVAGNHLNLWPYYVVPNLVKKFDVDLVIFLFTPNDDLVPFYLYPYSAEGIPTERPDNEYMLKPLEQRLQPGLPKDLFELCKEKNLVTVSHNQPQFAFFDQLIQVPNIREKLTQLMAKPTVLLREKLDSMRTTSGKPVRLEMALLPPGRFAYGTPEGEAFWDKFLQEVNAPILDLTSPMNALRFSFYPLSQVGGYDHLSADGHLLMGLLLAEELIHEKLVPFEPVKK